MKLRAAARNKLPASSFGIPGERKYPMPDQEHAAKAKGRATEAVHKGWISASTEAHIDAKANRILGETRNTAAEVMKRRRGK